VDLYPPSLYIVVLTFHSSTRIPQMTHFQEPTQVSTTDTVVERLADREPLEPSSEPIPPFTRGGVQSSTSLNHDREATLDSQSIPPVIPPKHDNRTLVLCFDGTGDQFDADNSNVVQFVSLLKKHDNDKQRVYYQVWKSCSVF
jgi:hypothetical protein